MIPGANLRWVRFLDQKDLHARLAAHLLPHPILTPLILETTERTARLRMQYDDERRARAVDVDPLLAAVVPDWPIVGAPCRHPYLAAESGRCADCHDLIAQPAIPAPARTGDHR